MNQFSLIYYHVPQDNDDQNEPNVFGINLIQNDIRLKDIKNSFPLQGNYIFRVKQDQNKQISWLDIQSEQEQIPTIRGKIYLKATRISWNNENLEKKNDTINENFKKDVNFQNKDENNDLIFQNKPKQQSNNLTNSGFNNQQIKNDNLINLEFNENQNNDDLLEL